MAVEPIWARAGLRWPLIEDRRVRLVAALAALSMVIAGGVVASGILGVRQVLGAERCSIRVDGQARELSPDEARTLTELAAAARRDGPGKRETARAAAELARQLDGNDRLATALSGFGGPALTCIADAPDGRREAEGRNGLTPRAETLRAAMERAFGDLPLGGFAPGGVRSGHIPGSAHYEGRAVDVFFRPVSRENQRKGWVLAQWLVAHAEDFDIATVIFADRIWTQRRSGEGWRHYQHPSGNRSNPILRHLDHVHVDVARG
jgi:hypothetical protein